ncbi:MAG: DegT/DnrJ/EryC1/StrS family aminotransferase [Nitrospinales bacterium]
MKPAFDLTELFRAAWPGNAGEEARMEAAFAEKFRFSAAVFFPYGRTAIHALLRTMGWRNREIVVPAYTCVVVPHTVMLSGNRVSFVDCQADYFHPSAGQLADRLGPGAAMVVPTPLYGYPLDGEGYRQAIQERSPGVFVLYDAAQCFGLQEASGRFQFEDADAVLLALGVGKLLCSLTGGLMLFKDASLAKQVRAYRDRTFIPPTWGDAVAKWAYGAAVWAAFRNPVLVLTHFLEHKTSLLHTFTEDLYGKTGPSLPAGNNKQPTALQARLARLQLRRYPEIIKEKRRISSVYENLLQQEGFKLFPHRSTPTYAQFPLQVKARDPVMAALLDRGIQAGNLIDYSCPDLPGYEGSQGTCPNASQFGREMINLPNGPYMPPRDVERVVRAMVDIRQAQPDWFR